MFVRQKPISKMGREQRNRCCSPLCEEFMVVFVVAVTGVDVPVRPLSPWLVVTIPPLPSQINFISHRRGHSLPASCYFRPMTMPPTNSGPGRDWPCPGVSPVSQSGLATPFRFITDRMRCWRGATNSEDRVNAKWLISCHVQIVQVNVTVAVPRVPSRFTIFLFHVCNIYPQQKSFEIKPLVDGDATATSRIPSNLTIQCFKGSCSVWTCRRQIDGVWRHVENGSDLKSNEIRLWQSTLNAMLEATVTEDGVVQFQETVDHWLRVRGEARCFISLSRETLDIANLMRQL